MPSAGSAFQASATWTESSSGTPPAAAAASSRSISAERAARRSKRPRCVSCFCAAFGVTLLFSLFALRIPLSPLLVLLRALLVAPCEYRVSRSAEARPKRVFILAPQVHAAGLLPALLQRDRRLDRVAQPGLLQRLRLRDQVLATPGLLPARCVEPRVERFEDPVEPLAERALGLPPGQRAEAPGKVAALRFDFLERRRGRFRTGEPRVDLVAQCGARVGRGFGIDRELGAEFEHRFERARQYGVEPLPLHPARGMRRVALLPLVAQHAHRGGERLDIGSLALLILAGEESLGGLDELLTALVVAPLRPVAHVRKLREVKLELTVEAGGQRRRSGAAGDLLLDLQRLRQPPGVEVLLELAEEAAKLVPLRSGRFLLLPPFLVERRGSRERILVQLLSRALKRARERGGRRVAGKPSRAFVGQPGKPLAECGEVQLRSCSR